MLPLVGSTMTPPGCSAPLRSASSTIARAMRSFTEPPGLKYSTLARTVAAIPSVTRFRRTSGVPADEVDDVVGDLHGRYLRERGRRGTRVHRPPGTEPRVPRTTLVVTDE